MFKNYFKTAWRSLWKNKFYTAINISGLAVGLAAGIMLLLWVQNELSYDKFHKDYENIYELSAHFQDNGEERTWTGVPGPLAVYAKFIPQVQSVVRINSGGGILSNADNSKIIDGNRTAYVDSTFFSIFDFKLLKGNKANLFPNNNSVVLTQSTAEKFFGTADAAIGKVIIFQKNNFIVTAILKDFPENSSLKYDAIFPMSFYAKEFTANGGNGDWKTIDEDLGDYFYDTYVKLQPGTDPGKIGLNFSLAYKKARNSDSEAQFQLQNLGAIHLIGADGNDAALRMVQIFMLVAILLLLIASINYVNLSTARSLVRAKEVSIRKIVGANKTQLFFQFITETFLLFCISTVIAIVLLMPFYNRISGKKLQFSLANGHVLQVIGFSIIGT